MGNCSECYNTEISFEYKYNQNITNLYLIKTEFNNKI